MKLPRPLIVGVSGGADSTYLIHELAKVDASGLIICHVNHGLRGEEADLDSQFVADLAKRLEVQFELKVLNLKEELGEDAAFEAIARDARLAYFSELSQKYETTNVALAHHQDDQAETILMNLCRGSIGLKGMSAKSKYEGLTLWRPLLEVTKSDIIARLNAAGISWREDPTNSQPVARRNRVRNEVMPLLNDIFQRKTAVTISRSYSGDQSELFSEVITHLELLDPQGRLFLPKFSQLSDSLQETVIHQYLMSHGVENLTKAKVGECVKISDLTAPSKVNLPGSQFFRRKEQRLFIDS